MIAQLLVVGFRGLTAAEADVAAVIREEGLGGVVLFDFDVPTRSPLRNVQSPQQVRELTRGLQALSSAPLIICVDQEGGRVARLNEGHGFPPTVSHEELGRRNDVAYTRQQAGQMAATLASVGINLNLAPVVDINVNPDNPVIGRLGRSFSADPRIVTTQAREFVRAHREHGVLCTLKHFPGHGSSSQDSHLGFVDVTQSWSPEELLPYRELIASGDADVVMTAHVFNARLDPQHPATLSRRTITGLLREELGFDGVVISDDMQMGAIRDHYSYEGAVELALNAGVDVLAIANNSVYEPDIARRTIDLIERLVREGRVPEGRIRESYARVQRLKSRLLRAAG
ncbi:MAG TPA: glycoside hydrolase family 3 N-terminal domain-containing protein [Dehalococcoidia bacterium]|nr:glycoside hydrolase family 3 N-terminal domain-containing protein [Dehalococcoidia bacterium]